MPSERGGEPYWGWATFLSVVCLALGTILTVVTANAIPILVFLMLSIGSWASARTGTAST